MTTAHTHRAARDAALPAPVDQRVLMRRFSVVLVVWVVVSSATVIGAADPRSAWSNLLVVAPIVVLPAACGLAYRLSPRFRATLLGLDHSAITAVQGMRIAGIAMLALWAAGQMTPGFALWAGGLDVFIGLTAVPLAYLVLTRRPLPRRSLRAWHTVGIVDFVVAVPVGLYAAPAVEQGSGVSTEAMFSFPLSFIPTVGVPFMIIMHAVALLQLRAGRHPQTRLIVHPSTGAAAGTT